MKTIAQVEQELITERLEEFKGNKTKAAQSLGITIKTLYNKLHAYGLFEKYSARSFKPKTLTEKITGEPDNQAE